MRVESSLSVATRVGVRELGAALLWWHQRGVRPRSRSDLVGLCVKFVAEQLGEENWPDVSDALYTLDTYYPVQTRRGTKILSAQKSERYKTLVEASERVWREGFEQSLRKKRDEEEELLGKAASKIVVQVEMAGQRYVIVQSEENKEFVAKTLGQILERENVRVATTEEIIGLREKLCATLGVDVEAKIIDLREQPLEEKPLGQQELGQQKEEKPRVDEAKLKEAQDMALTSGLLQQRGEGEGEKPSGYRPDSGDGIEVLEVVKQPEPSKETFRVAKDMLCSMVVSTDEEASPWADPKKVLSTLITSSPGIAKGLATEGS